MPQPSDSLAFWQAASANQSVGRRMARRANAPGRVPSQSARRVDGCQRTSSARRFSDIPDRSALVDRLVSDLELGRIHSVAFVVPSDVSWTLPLYDIAITTARRGWKIGIEDARYWFVTPEPEPLASFGTAVSVAVRARLEPEGITFIGSTYADVRQGVVLLDPQAERIEVDRIVSLGHSGGFDVDSQGVTRRT